jgi:hypothetical protein
VQLLAGKDSDRNLYVCVQARERTACHSRGLHSSYIFSTEDDFTTNDMITLTIVAIMSLSP